MTLKPGEQTIAIHILSNMPRSKGKHTMEFGRLIKYMRKIFFFKKHAQNETRRIAQDLFLHFKKALHESKAMQVVDSIYFLNHQHIIQ